jgi:hypothetical protein
MSQAAKFSLGLLVMQFLLSIGGDAIAADSVKLGVVSTSQIRNDLFISKAQITKEPKWNPDAGAAPPVALQDVATKARVLLSSLGATDAKDRRIASIILRRVPETDLDVWFYEVRFDPQPRSDRTEGNWGYDQVPVLMSGQPPISKPHKTK